MLRNLLFSITMFILLVGNGVSYAKAGLDKPEMETFMSIVILKKENDHYYICKYVGNNCVNPEKKDCMDISKAIYQFLLKYSSQIDHIKLEGAAASGPAHSSHSEKTVDSEKSTFHPSPKTP